MSKVSYLVSDFFVCFKVIFGEDVAFGGVFRCTVGLRDKYGEYFSFVITLQSRYNELVYYKLPQITN